MGLLLELMQEFHAESAFVLNTDLATGTFHRLLSDNAAGAVWLAGYGATVEAYIVVTFRFSMEFGGSEAFIDDLYVRRRSRRRGLGSALLKEVFAECARRQVCAVKVEVGHDNGPARTLYERFRLHEIDRLILAAEFPHRPMSERK